MTPVQFLDEIVETCIKYANKIIIKENVYISSDTFQGIKDFFARTEGMLVQQIGEKKSAINDTSVKFVIHVWGTLKNIFGYRDIAD